MKKILTLFAILVAATFVLNGYITQASNQDRFWAEAAQGGMAEVELGNMALQKSQNEKVRQFAQMIVDDHTKANEELKTLAASKNVTLPTDVNTKQKSTMNKLNSMSGTNFDKEFIKTMIKDHENTIRLFERESERGNDADAKAFAAKNLPTLRSHLEMARSLNGDMKNMTRDDKAGDNMNSNRMNSNGSNTNMNSNRNMNSSNDSMDSDRNMNSNQMMNSNSMNSNMMNSNKMMNSNMTNSNQRMNSNTNMRMNSNTNTNRNNNSNNNTNRNTNSNTNRNSNTNANGNVNGL